MRSSHLKDVSPWLQSIWNTYLGAYILFENCRSSALLALACRWSLIAASS